MRLQQSSQCPARQAQNYIIKEHNEIPVSTRRLRDFFRLKLWWVCINCDEYREKKQDG